MAVFHGTGIHASEILGILEHQPILIITSILLALNRLSASENLSGFNPWGLCGLKSSSLLSRHKMSSFHEVGPAVAQKLFRLSHRQPCELSRMWGRCWNAGWNSRNPWIDHMQLTLTRKLTCNCLQAQVAKLCVGVAICCNPRDVTMNSTNRPSTYQECLWSIVSTSLMYFSMMFAKS